IRKGDPGNPDICLVFSYHKKFNQGEVPEIEKCCRSGALGCFDCKMNCASKISAFLEPIREKRKYFENNLNEVKDILADGEERGRAVAMQTMNEVHAKMGMG
ncbi:MAG: tryptophan--tRNA ligase, partial [Ignavibacteriaceae bacterium]